MRFQAQFPLRSTLGYYPMKLLEQNKQPVPVTLKQRAAVHIVRPVKLSL
jgi:hypothetical protein